MNGDEREIKRRLQMIRKIEETVEPKSKLMQAIESGVRMLAG